MFTQDTYDVVCINKGIQTTRIPQQFLSVFHNDYRKPLTEASERQVADDARPWTVWPVVGWCWGGCGGGGGGPGLGGGGLPSVVTTHGAALAVPRVRDKHARSLTECSHDVQQTEAWTLKHCSS